MGLNRLQVMRQLQQRLALGRLDQPAVAAEDAGALEPRLELRRRRQAQRLAQVQRIVEGRALVGSDFDPNPIFGIALRLGLVLPL